MGNWSFLAFVALWSLLSYSEAYRRVCYLSNWAQYRPAPANFFPSSCDASLCSHINYAFAVVDGNNNIQPYEWNDDTNGGLYQQTLALRNGQPGLTVSIAVGGWNFGMAQISLMLATSANRSTFINSAITFARARDFDGIDIDFEYPGSRGSPAGDKFLFTNFLQEFRAAIDNDATTSGKPALIFTAAVGAGQTTIDTAYEIDKIFQYLDYVNLMTYDYNGAWDTITGLNSPLYSRADEVGQMYGGMDRDTLNMKWSAEYWVSLGAPKDKLVIGLALYGRCFTLADAAQNGLGAPVTGPCKNGTYTREAGFLSYYEICTLITNGATRNFSTEQRSPYIYQNDQWIGYDDPTSHQEKVEYITGNGYAGVMVWNVDLDDFSGNLGCSSGAYPLLKAINKYLSDASTGTPAPTTITATPTTATPAPTTSTPAPTTPAPSTAAPTTAAPTTAAPSTSAPSTSSGSGFSCTGQPDGNYVNPSDCTSFYQCSNEMAHLSNCTPGLYYDDVIDQCNWPDQLSASRKADCGVAS